MVRDLEGMGLGTGDTEVWRPAVWMDFMKWTQCEDTCIPYECSPGSGCSKICLQPGGQSDPSVNVSCFLQPPQCFSEWPTSKVAIPARMEAMRGLNGCPPSTETYLDVSVCYHSLVPDRRLIALDLSIMEQVVLNGQQTQSGYGFACLSVVFLLVSPTVGLQDAFIITVGPLQH